MPRSSALYTTRRVASRSMRPPKLLQPRPTTDARRSDRPMLRCCTSVPLKNCVAGNPPSDQMMRNGHAHRAAQPVRVAAVEHEGDFVAREPAPVLKFVAVEGDLPGEGLADAAHHEIGRKGPGLRGDIAHRADAYAGFLEGFAAHRVLDRLARLDEAGEARIHAGGETGLPAEEAALAAGDEHDGDRIGARKVLRAAGR